MTILIIIAGYVGFCVLWAAGWGWYYERRWAKGKGAGGAEGVPAAAWMMMPVIVPLIPIAWAWNKAWEIIRRP